MIIIDSNYLCYVNRFALSQGLSYQGHSTEIIFGFLRHVLELSKSYKTTNIVFCWDSRESLRRKIYPQYKMNRRENLTDEEKESNRQAYIQFDTLKKSVLLDMGFKNVFHQDGYESDDIIASLVIGNSDKNITVVSSDKDLYQLLDYCSLYNITKRETYTKSLFMREFGIRPFRWGTVKSIAGCQTDNVEGLTRVGEHTAIKYLKGEIKEGSKTYERIKFFDSSLTKKLVTLPFEGCENYQKKLQKNNFSEKAFLNIFDKFGFKSFIDNFDEWESVFFND